MEAKIKHFPNLVCWQEIFKHYDSKRDQIYLDSFSCYLLGIILGIKGKYFPGSEMAKQLILQSSDLHYFLLSEEINSIALSQKHILPYRESFEGDQDLLTFIKTIPHNASVIIGIGSPKQNTLANYLWSIRPDLCFYCIGAAVSQTWENDRDSSFLIGSGFQWLEFLLFQPSRTLSKLTTTFIEFFSILTSVKKLRNYKEFIESSLCVD